MSSVAHYEPGTVAVATVRGVPNVRIVRGGPHHWVEAADTDRHYRDGIPRLDGIKDIRPLVVLDLHGDEAIRGTPEPPACHVPECPYLAATCPTHRDAEVALARVRALIDSSWPTPREAMGAFVIPTPMFDSAQRNALRTALAGKAPNSHPSQKLGGRHALGRQLREAGDRTANAIRGFVRAYQTEGK